MKKLLLPSRLVLTSPLHAEWLLSVRLRPATLLTMKYPAGSVFAFSMRSSAWTGRPSNHSHHGLFLASVTLKKYLVVVLLSGSRLTLLILHSGILVKQQLPQHKTIEPPVKEAVAPPA
jgi:hypothetical protein